MKYRLDSDTQSERPIDVRLYHTPHPDGVSLQVRKVIGSGNWITILTLTEKDGVLVLRDINSKVLSAMGFDMTGDVRGIGSPGHIAVRLA